MEAKVNEIILELTKKTREGKIKWKRTELDFIMKCEISNYSFEIRKYTHGPGLKEPFSFVFIAYSDRHGQIGSNQYGNNQSILIDRALSDLYEAADEYLKKAIKECRDPDALLEIIKNQ
jgi:hypothetical protein